MLPGAIAALAIAASACGAATPVGNQALPSSSPQASPDVSASPPASPASEPSTSAASAAAPLASPAPTPEPSPDCSYYPGPSVPRDSTPLSLRVGLELAETTLRTGEMITGELVLENVSDERVYYWEGYWPRGLIQDERWVGGYDNLALITGGWERDWIDPGEVKRYPRDWHGFGAWGGTIDTLGCRKSHSDERTPLPPGTYTAIVSFPVGERFEKPVWDEGAQDRVEIRIVP